MAEPFRQGSTHRPLLCIAFTSTARVNFPAEFPGGVTFRMVKGSTVITGAAVGDASGNLSYQWGATDLDIVGTYAGYFIATDGSGRKETLPSGYNLAIEVVATI